MTGLRINIEGISARLAAAKSKLTASAFKPELLAFAKATLTTCVALTPVRDPSLIEASQAKQYASRVNYIPSVHTLEDPTLIVKEDGAEWLFSGGKWYQANWKLPADAWAAYQGLAAERMRRLETDQQSFIEERAQARFLYQRSWTQCAASIGLRLSVGDEIVESHTRQDKEPPRGYAQWHQGARRASISISNPFLEIESHYKPFSGKAILATATQVNRATFDAKVALRVKRVLREVKLAA